MYPNEGQICPRPITPTRNGLDKPNGEKQRGIPIAQSQQENAVNTLHAALSELEKRLQPVLRQEPCDPCNAKAETPTPSSVMGRIELATLGVDAAIARLNILLNQLEV